jgi:lipopolysaccharide assembly outer membrane protein LptD (OstA)
MVLFTLEGFVKAHGIEKVYTSSEKEIPFCQLLPDTIAASVPDSSAVDSLAAKSSKEALEAKVDYKAKDSTLFDLVNHKVFLYGGAEINYKDINLKADYIEINFDKNEIYATGMPDSTGKMAGIPVFKQGSQNFKSQVMRYNFKSKKGYISKVLTEDGSGYLHGTGIPGYRRSSDPAGPAFWLVPQ